MTTRYLTVLLMVAAIAACSGGQKNAQTIEIPSLTPLAKVDPGIYGHFYEHIYHSANGGLWGDLVWNRSFEEFVDKPVWTKSGGVVSQTSLANDVKLILGDPSWTDYEFTLEARKDGGYEGFLILFRAAGEEDFYWLNLGGWNNSQHGLEKEVKGRREVVTPFVGGSVPLNRWVPIRIRVSGNRFDCYMDEALVLTHTDTAGAIASGAVGIGSWGTAVSYRNLKVTEADGKTLYQGVPDVQTDPSFPRHWIPSDPGRILVSKGKALNGETAIEVKSSEVPVTLTQEKFAVRAGDTITGSLWVKGSDKAEVLIRIENSEGRKAEVEVEGIGDQWEGHPVSLILPGGGQAPKDSWKLVIQVKGNVLIDQVSLMAESARRNDGFRTDLYEAVAGIRPTVIRWPGGCFAELYRWKAGIGQQHERQVFPVNIWDDRDVNSLGTDEFITLCRKLNAEPLLVINSGFHEGAGTPEAWKPWVEEACEWLEYCNGPADSKWGSVRAVNGHPEPYAVKYWEIDNELWRSRVPDAHIYSQAVKIFAEALKKVDPSIVVIAHGGNGTDMEWNQVVLNEAAGHFDILSIHHYSDPNGFYTAALDQDTLYKNLRKSIAASKNPDIKVYVSEWNAQSTDWRTGLYAGNLLNLFEANADVVTLAGPALFLRHTTANAWDNAFINFNEKGWFPAPNYVVMKLWREHFAPELLAMNALPDSVVGVATFDGADCRLVVKLVNNRTEALNLGIRIPEPEGAFNPSGAMAYRVTAASLRERNTLEEPSRIGVTEEPLRISRQKINVNLPALSTLLIEIK